MGYLRIIRPVWSSIRQTEYFSHGMSDIIYELCAYTLWRFINNIAYKNFQEYAIGAYSVRYPKN